MIRLALLFTLLSSLGWLGPPKARTQLAGVELQVTEVADSGDYFVYRYTIFNPQSSAWGISMVKVDISAAEGTPDNLPVTGDLLDVTADIPSQPHAQVGPITPPGWGASLTATAELRWYPPSTGLSTSDSIAPGEARSGFGIRSSYFPGITTVVAEPTVESCCLVLADTTDGAFYPSRRSFGVTGVAVVPRYQRHEVNLPLLAEQLQTVCSTPRWVDDTALCGRLEGHLVEARERAANSDSGAAQASLDSFLRALSESRRQAGGVTRDAYWLLLVNGQRVRDGLAPEL